jgi:uncharacterized membrane protein YhhN
MLARRTTCVAGFSVFLVGAFLVIRTFLVVEMFLVVSPSLVVATSLVVGALLIIQTSLLVRTPPVCVYSRISSRRSRRARLSLRTWWSLRWGTGAARNK